MDLFDELGPEVARELGLQRQLVPARLILAGDAAEQLARAVAELVPGGRVGVLFDTRTRQVAGERCLAALRQAGLEAVPHLVPDRGDRDPICDDVTEQRLLSELPELGFLLGVGSGTVSDLAKWVAFQREIPAAIFGTAASMNGYAAANVAPSIEGVKSLFSARAHRFVAADPAVLAAAPLRLTSAGLGDIIAKSVSTADWKMNELLFGERFVPAVAGIIDELESHYTERPQAIAAGDAAAISSLFRALVYSGCAMTLQGSSMPASGGEHLVSHTLDMRAELEGSEHDLHGRQVGVGTIFAAALYERVLALDSPVFSPGPLPFDAAAWGARAGSVRSHFEKQSARLAEACDKLRQPGVWDRLRDALRPMLPSARWVKEILSGAGGAHRFEDIGVSRERLTWAVLNGAQIRERFTSLDLAWATGVLPGAASEIIDAYLS